jgi:group I intron endonuclease
MSTMINSQGGIYMIHCSGNGSVYIGKTNNFNDRFKTHRSKLRLNKNDPNTHIQNTYNKYGEDSFSYTPLVSSGTEIFRIQLEQYWSDLMIDSLGRDKVMNKGECVESPMLGKSHTDEARQKISSKSKGRKHTEEARARISNTKTGKKRTPFTAEHCTGISVSLTGKKHKPFTAEHRANIALAHLGKKRAPFCKQLVALATGEV